MARQIEFTGKSGSIYRYTALEEERALPPAGANFVIARITPEGAALLFVGETDNLSSRSWRQPLSEAKDAYGDADVLMRLNVRSAVRMAERDDLIQQHQPPMNAAHQA